jgi:hypothetical protein
MNTHQLPLGFGAVAPVGRIIPNPPGLILTAANRRVRDNAPYLANSSSPQTAPWFA